MQGSIHFQKSLLLGLTSDYILSYTSLSNNVGLTNIHTKNICFLTNEMSKYKNSLSLSIISDAFGVTHTPYYIRTLRGLETNHLNSFYMILETVPRPKCPCWLSNT